MYARGMSTREIQWQLEEIYKVEVSPTLISNVTETVMEEIKRVPRVGGVFLGELFSTPIRFGLQ
jgi:hypothetical protein